jgi:hypothetical protein
LKAAQLQEAGITQSFWNDEVKEGIELKPEEIGAQVLKFQHLAAGFVVILFLLLLSFVVFAVEFAPKLWMNLKAWLKKNCCRLHSIEIPENG